MSTKLLTIVGCYLKESSLKTNLSGAAANLQGSLSLELKIENKPEIHIQGMDHEHNEKLKEADERGETFIPAGAIVHGAVNYTLYISKADNDDTNGSESSQDALIVISATYIVQQKLTKDAKDKDEFEATLEYWTRYDSWPIFRSFCFHMLVSMGVKILPPFPVTVPDEED